MMRLGAESGDMIRLLVAIWAVAAIAAGCRGAVTNGGAGAPAPHAKELALPEVPPDMTDVQQRLEFVLEHFWDSMDWTDAAMTGNDEFMEQNMVNYFDVMALADSLTASRGVRRMVAAAAVSPAALDKMAEIAGMYLYAPESPMYRPASYAVFIDALKEIDSLPQTTAARLDYDRKTMMKNRPGTRAADFRFVLRQGGSTTLDRVKGERTILMFYDSDCGTCAETERLLAGSSALNNAISQGRIKIVAVDTYTPSAEEWRIRAQALPDNWTVGYSPGGAVDGDEIYYLRTTPALYLLDSDMTVLVKDADAATVRSWCSAPPLRPR